MTQYATIAEIAKAVGMSDRVLQIKAKAWQGGRRKSGTKAKEFPIDQLPPDIRDAMTNRLGDEGEAHATPTEEKGLLTVGGGDRPALSREVEIGERMDAWIELLRIRVIWCRDNHFPKVVDCDVAFAAAYNAGQIEVPDWIRRFVSDLSRSTLARKRAALQQGGVASLNGGYGSRKGQSKIGLNPAMRDLVVGLIAGNLHITASHILRALQVRFPGESLPALATVQRFVARWRSENQEVFTALTNPDQWKGAYMVAFGSQSEGIASPNQRWELDSTPADVMLADGRYSVLGVIDVFSRRSLLLVAKTSKATAIALLLRRALMEWGVPETVKTDNGKDYVSRHLTRVFAELGIEHEQCPPFQPWHKPHIERFFKTFSHDLPPLLPGFIGHNVSDREALRSQQEFADRLFKKGGAVEVHLTAPEFQSLCDRWLVAYENRANDGVDGKTPFEVWTSSTATLKRIPDLRALDLLLAEGGIRTVGKKGIQLDGEWFIAPELEAFVRQQVQVRFDPVDLGRIYVFDLESRFVCVAECPYRTGISRQEVAVRAKERQRKRVQELRSQLRQQTKAVKTDEIVAEILQAEIEAAEKLIAFPQAGEVVHTAALQGAADALVVPVKKVQPMTTEEQRDRIAQLEVIEQKQVALDPVTVISKVFRAWKKGASVSPEEFEFASHCCQLPEGAGVASALADDRTEERQFLSYLKTALKTAKAV